ncbi:SDR family NAD(P)-dependent oxidoreductase [Halococcus salsus]|uniref:SDR family NAD(P)-dependent oxidoreductase n=1 Tax=Halococcus salsus TaxID=2162894 RepID=UPI0013569A0F|nr:SDR family oxidoreductase [Halococcus salsus]
MSGQQGRLQDKVALITGGANGIGRATTERFLEEGARVVVGDIEEPEPYDAGDADFVELNVADEDDWENVADHIQSEYGQLDVLFNNAGIIAYDTITEIDLETWENEISVDQTGVMLGMKHSIPVMRETGGGSIINSSSIWGNVGAEGTAAYQAAKGAVRNMSKNAAITYADDDIRVNSLHPGAIDTPLMERQDDELNEAVIAATPMGRQADPREIANGVLFVASDEASFMTGSELVIDGGYLAQ